MKDLVVYRSMNSGALLGEKAGVIQTRADYEVYPWDDVYRFVLEEASRFRQKSRGFALGSGNSIPPYVPVEGYLAMIRAAQELRNREARSQVSSG